LFNLIRKDVRQLVKANKPRHDIRDLQDAAVSNREEINKLKEEIEAVNRTLEIEKKKSKKREILNKILILVNFLLSAGILYFLVKK
jgi:wobble nucleotide-excising tRNase